MIRKISQLMMTKRLKFKKINNSFKHFGNFEKFSFQKNKTGLFSKASVQNPVDLITNAQLAVEKCSKLQNQLHNVNNSTLNVDNMSDLLKIFDSISNILCIEIDGAELCRNIHMNENFKETAENAFTMISTYIHELNNDIKMYNLLCAIILKNQDL